MDTRFGGSSSGLMQRLRPARIDVADLLEVADTLLPSLATPRLRVDMVQRSGAGSIVVVEEDERQVRIGLHELADDMTRAGVAPTAAGISAALISWVAHRPVPDAAAAATGIAVLDWTDTVHTTVGWRVVVLRRASRCLDPVERRRRGRGAPHPLGGERARPRRLAGPPRGRTGGAVVPPRRPRAGHRRASTGADRAPLGGGRTAHMTSRWTSASGAGAGVGSLRSHAAPESSVTLPWPARRPGRSGADALRLARGRARAMDMPDMHVVVTPHRPGSPAPGGRGSPPGRRRGRDAREASVTLAVARDLADLAWI